MVGSLIELISVTNSLHNYAVQQLYKHLTGDLEAKQPMIQVTMWALGEYADLLNAHPIVENETNDFEANQVIDISEESVIDKCEQILATNSMTIITKEYTIGALIKLSVRFPNTEERVKSLVDVYGCDHSVELQQRAVEFSTLFSKHNYLRPSVFERMPPMTVRAEKRNGVTNGETVDEDINIDVNDMAVNQTFIKPSPQSNSSALLDLLDVNLSPVKTNDSIKSVPISDSIANNVLDLLGGIDLNPTTDSTSNNINSIFNNTVNESQNTNNLFDSFLSEDKPIPPINNSIPSIVAFDKNGLKLEFSFERPTDNPTLITISLTATNSSQYPIEEFLFQAAVPKVCSNILLGFTYFMIFVRHSNYN